MMPFYPTRDGYPSLFDPEDVAGAGATNPIVYIDCSQIDFAKRAAIPERLRAERPDDGSNLRVRLIDASHGKIDPWRKVAG